MSDVTPVIVVTMAAPVEAVWDALREKEKVRHWFGWEYEGLDAEIDGIYFTEVDEDEATHTLTVRGGDRFTVEPYEGGSKLILTRAPRDDDDEWAAYYDDVTEGWITFLHQLTFALERHPGQPRNTLFYAGMGNPDPAELFGIAAAVGASYQADLCGQAATGTVWFRSEHQVGVTVDQWGDGLLVLSHVGPTESKPSAAAMAVLTLYDVDAATREALAKSWSDWWTARYPAAESQEG